MAFTTFQWALVFTPLLLRVVVSQIREAQNGQDPSIAPGLIAAIFIAIIAIAGNTAAQWQYVAIMTNGVALRGGLILAVVSRATRLKDSTRFSDGAILNLVAGDSSRLLRLFQFASDLWTMSGQIVIVIVILLIVLGWTALIGTTVILMGVATNLWLSRKIYALRLQATELADSRIQRTHAALSHITAVKLQAYEASIVGRIQAIRQQEIRTLRLRKACDATDSLLGNCMPVIALTITFLVWITATNAQVDAQTVFSSFILFRMAVNPLLYLSRAIASTSDGLHGADRITEFLRMPLRESSAQPIQDEKLAVDAVGSFTWPRAEDAIATPFALSLDLKIPRGELVAVVGPVGHGKTALVRTLLDGLDCAEGHLRLAPTVLGTDQRNYIVSGDSLRDQIIFNAVVDEDLYRRVLEWTSLDQDVLSFPHGDLTQLGERGLTVSGGQASRICLARALYAAHVRHADILVLDDPLSALDSRVGSHVFDQAIAPLSGTMTCVVATHALHFAHRFDRILYLGESGQITENGSYDELVKANGGFAQLVRDHGSTAETSEQTKLSAEETGDRSANSIMREDDSVSTGATHWSTYVAFAKLSSGPLHLVFIGLGFVGMIGSILLGALSLLWYTEDSFGWSPGGYVRRRI